MKFSKLFLGLALVSAGLMVSACGGAKELAPKWTQGKPIDPSGAYVYGLGMSYINPNVPYQNTARQNALADIAQELRSDINATSTLLVKESASGLSSQFQSETETNSRLKLSNYEAVESYSDGVRYYTLYKLDLAAYKSERAAAEVKAMEWIKAQLAKATSTHQLAIADRLQFISDALIEANEEQLDLSPRFGNEVASALIDALRHVEQGLQGEILQPENVNYLGMPEGFSAYVRLHSTLGDVQSLPLRIESSSGEFHLSENAAVFCSHTGRKSPVELRVAMDWKGLSNVSNSAVQQWFEINSRWALRSTVHFQPTAITMVAPEPIQDLLGPALANGFALVEGMAPLELICTHKSFTTKSGASYKHQISLRYQLRNAETKTVIWSSDALESSAISTNEEQALNAALSAAYDDFSYFILPQLKRALGY